MAYFPAAPNAAGTAVDDPLAELQRLADPSCVPPEQSHYLMKLMLARLPQNRKEELSLHLFPKALDLMTQNNLWDKLLPFVPCWFKYRAQFALPTAAPAAGSSQQQSKSAPPKQTNVQHPPPSSSSVKSGVTRDFGAVDWTATPSEPMPVNQLIITPPPTPTEIILTLPSQPLAVEDPLSNPYRMCDAVQSFYLLKLLLARLPVFDRSKVANPLLVLAVGFMHQNRLWHELSPFNPTWSKLKLSPSELKTIHSTNRNLQDPHSEDPLSEVTLREFNNEQTFYLLKLLLARLPPYLRPLVSPILLKKGMQILLENGIEKHLAPYDPNFSKNKTRVDSGNSSLGSTTLESTETSDSKQQILVTNMVKTLPQLKQPEIPPPPENPLDISLTTHVNSEENRSTSTSPGNEAVAVSPPKEENIFRPIQPALPTPSVQQNADKDGGRSQSVSYGGERGDAQNCNNNNRSTSEDRGFGRGGRGGAYAERSRPGRGNFGRGGGGRSGRYSPGGHYYDFSGNDKPDYDWTIQPTRLKQDATVPAGSSPAPGASTSTPPANVSAPTVAATSGGGTSSDIDWSAPCVDEPTASTSATTVPESIPKEPEQAAPQPSSSAAAASPPPPKPKKPGFRQTRCKPNPDGSYPIDLLQYTKRDMMMMLITANQEACEKQRLKDAADLAALTGALQKPSSPANNDWSNVDWSAPSPTAPAEPVASTSSAATASPQSQQSTSPYNTDQQRNRNDSGSSWNGTPSAEAANWTPPHLVQQQPLSKGPCKSASGSATANAPSAVDGPTDWSAPPTVVSTPNAPSAAVSTPVSAGPTDWSAPPTIDSTPNAPSSAAYGPTDWSSPPTANVPAVSTPVSDGPTDWSAPPTVDNTETSGKLRSSFKIAPDCANAVYGNEQALSPTSAKSGNVIYYSAQPKPQVISKPKYDGNNSVLSQESVQQAAPNREQNFSAPRAREVAQDNFKVDDWAAPPPKETENTDWSAPPKVSAPPPANVNTDWSAPPVQIQPVTPEAQQKTVTKPTTPIPQNFDWSSKCDDDVVVPAAAPVAAVSQPVPPPVQSRPDYSPSSYNRNSRNGYVDQKPQPSLPQEIPAQKADKSSFDWGTKSEENVVVPAAVTSQPVQPRPDYSPSNYANDNSRNGFVDQKPQPSPPQTIPAQQTDLSNFDWSSPASPPATPVVPKSPADVQPSGGGTTPNFQNDPHAPRQGGDHDRARSASNFSNAGSEDSRRGGRGGYRGRGGYNNNYNGYANGGGESFNNDRPQQYSNENGGYNSRGGGTGGWNNSNSGDTPRGGGGGYRGSFRGNRGGGGFNSYNGYGNNDQQQQQSQSNLPNSQVNNSDDWSAPPKASAPPPASVDNTDWSAPSKPAAAAPESPTIAALKHQNRVEPWNRLPQSPPLGTVFTEPVPDIPDDFDWSSGPGPL